jgi:hypothetical protein
MIAQGRAISQETITVTARSQASCALSKLCQAQVTSCRFSTRPILLRRNSSMSPRLGSIKLACHGLAMASKSSVTQLLWRLGMGFRPFCDAGSSRWHERPPGQQTSQLRGKYGALHQTVVIVRAFTGPWKHATSYQRHFATRPGSKYLHICIGCALSGLHAQIS